MQELTAKQGRDIMARVLSAVITVPGSTTMSQPKLSRRDLLKVLAAAAGTAALSSVPNKWKTPVVEVGMLPAHAQGLSGLGAIQVTAAAIDAPISKLKAPNQCDFAQVSIDGHPEWAPQCCTQGGTVTFSNIPTGDYTVQCWFASCGNAQPKVAHVVAPAAVSLTFYEPQC
jgi:hypothetical protein